MRDINFILKWGAGSCRYSDLRSIYFFTLLGLILFVSGCGKAGEAPTVTNAPSSESSTNVSSQKSVDLSTAGTLKGKVSFEGAAPAPKQISVKGNPECAALHPGGVIASEELVVNNGALQNVFVYVKTGLENYSFPVPQEAVTVENLKCTYVPHVSGVQVGQNVNFLNKDSTLHNIHSYPKASKAFNLGLPLEGMKQVKKFDASEIMVPLKCDVHPWMLGYIGVLPHPYFSVSDSSGQFELKGLPPGEYTIEAWHEKLGVQSQKITLAAQETKEIEFKFKAE